MTDGTTTIPVDFSIHRKKGGDGSWGLTAGELRKQFRKKREKESPSMERLMEADRSQSNDFDAQVADITITLMTYIVAALDLRFSEYETMGQLFDSMAGELTKLTLWNTTLECIEKIHGNLIGTLGLNIDDVVAGILRDNEVADETIFLARVLADYRRTNRSNCLTSVRHVLNVHG